jgi:hypothetical protein
VSPRLIGPSASVAVPETLPPELRPDQVWDRAADRLLEVGWTQAVEVDPTTGALCADAAVCWVLSGIADAPPAPGHPYLRLYEFVVRQTNAAVGTGYTTWNDHPDRTRDQVVAVFRRLAEQHRRAVVHLAIA